MQEVGSKLRTLVVPDEGDISSLLNFANIGSQSNGSAMLRYSRRIEIDQLQDLGYFFASCISKLLQLIKRNVDETMMLLSGTSSIQTKESFESIKERSILLLVALDDSQIESRVRGIILILIAILLSYIPSIDTHIFHSSFCRGSVVLTWFQTISRLISLLDCWSESL